MASTYLTRTPSGAGNRAVWTWSAWIKISGQDGNEALFNAGGWSAGQDGTGLVLYNGSFYTYWNSPSNPTTTAEVFRDPAAWYHVVLQANTSTLKVYINGSEVSSKSISGNGAINNTTANAIGRYSDNASGFFDGYMADVHFIDGTAYAPTTFGTTNSDGVWTPIVGPTVTYGTNGFYLKFSNSGAMGTDSSGNNNTLSVAAGTARQIIDTPTDGFSTLNGVRGVIGTNAGNSALSQGNLKAVQSGGYKQCEGTLYPRSGKWYWETYIAVGGSTDVGSVGIYTSGKAQGAYPGTTAFGYGYDSYGSGSSIHNGSRDNSYGVGYAQGDIMGTALDLDNGTLTFYKNNSSQGQAFSGIDASQGWGFGHGGYYGSTIVANFGQDSSFGAYKTAQNNADGNGVGDFYYAPPSGYLALCTDNLSSELTIPVDDGSSAFHTQLYTGTGSARTITNDANSGDFQPDWVWVKQRNDSTAHSNNLVDAIRGGTKTIYSNTTDSQQTITNGLTGFTTDGFTIGTNPAVNNNTINYKAWQWKAGGTAPANTYAVKVVSDTGNKYRFDDYGTSAITLELQEGGTFTFDQSDASNAGHPLRFSSTADGTHGGGSEYTTGVTTTGTPGQAGAKTVITVAGSAPTLYYYCSVHSGMGGQANTGSLFGFTNVKGTTQTVVSPNTTAGFSVINFTGTGGDTTIGHGLSSAPKMIIFKNLIDSSSWAVYHKDLGTTKRLLLDTTDGESTSSSFWNSTDPSSTVISLGSSGDSNGSGDSIIAYAFAEIEGYSKFNYYTGNGATNGSFVYTGFRPAYFMTRRKSAGSDGWAVFDSARDPYNGVDYYEFINNGSAEGSGTVRLDFLSNGFKLRQAGSSWNADAEDYIFMAFAENPFVSSAGTPVTAR